MKIPRIFSFLFLIIFCCGCSHLFGKTKVPVKTETSLVESSKVFRLDDLQAGGKIAITPFTAGVGVAADQDLDRLSLYIVKAATEELEKAGSVLRVFSDADRGAADLVLRGRITRRVSRDRVFPFRKGYQLIAVEAKLIKTDNQALVLQFTDRIKGPAQDNWQAIGTRMGRQIARYLLNLCSQE